MNDPTTNNPFAKTEIDTQMDALIAEVSTSDEFRYDGDDSASDAGDGGGVAAAGEGAPAGEPVTPPPTPPAPESKPDPGAGADPIAAAVTRELGLRNLEERLKAREQELAAREAALKDARVPDWAEALDSDPYDALTKLGRDPDVLVRRLIAKRFEVRGQEVPAELRASIESASKESATDRRLRALEAELARRDRDAAAQAFFDKVKAEAHEYVTKGPGEYAPTVAIVAKADPTRVHAEILEEISRDAREKAARDPNLPLLSFEEAAKRVEARWAPLRSVLGTPAPAPTPPPANASTSAQKPASGNQTPASPPPKAPGRPLLPWDTRPSDIEELGIREALAEAKRVSKLP